MKKITDNYQFDVDGFMHYLRKNYPVLVTADDNYDFVIKVIEDKIKNIHSIDVGQSAAYELAPLFSDMLPSEILRFDTEEIDYMKSIIKPLFSKGINIVSKMNDLDIEQKKEELDWLDDYGTQACFVKLQAKLGITIGDVDPLSIFFLDAHIIESIKNPDGNEKLDVVLDDICGCILQQLHSQESMDRFSSKTNGLEQLETNKAKVAEQPKKTNKIEEEVL